MKDLFDDIFGGLNRLYTEQSELAAIWLLKPLQTSKEKTVRICPDMLVRIENNALIDCSEDKPATHKIINCFGTMYDQFELTLIGLEDSQPLQIKI